MKKIQELQNELDNIQMRMDAILVVSDNTVPTTCEAGAKFELQSSVSEFSAVMFLTSYFGRIKMERSDNCVGFYTDLVHVGTYNQNERTLYFGGIRTKDGVKDAFVW
ncbi:hypothetical protein AGMMS49944_03830 [Spirochaetia bacterium]|nr:hypothetical protein AGMMS49944_03830 [Spirochaetia bacterium]